MNIEIENKINAISIHFGVGKDEVKSLFYENSGYDDEFEVFEKIMEVEDKETVERILNSYYADDMGELDTDDVDSYGISYYTKMIVPNYYYRWM